MSEETSQRPHSVGVCGIYCGACAAWRACHDQDDTPRLVVSCRIGQQPCGGCRSDSVRGACASCDKRDCAHARGLISCAECPELKTPCRRLVAFSQYAPHPHLATIIADLAEIRRLSEPVWAEQQRQRWSCAKCGARFTWYADACPACGEPVRAFNIPSGARL